MLVERGSGAVICVCTNYVMGEGLIEIWIDHGVLLENSYLM